MAGFDFSKKSHRTVQDFDFYSTRLAPIDYQAIIDAGEDWKDPHFPADDSSIVDIHAPGGGHEKWKGLEWRRPKDVYQDGEFSLFKEPGPNDIRQGLAGDCYYLSCLSSLAENPQRIKDIFLFDQLNDAGCYACTFYVNGEKRTVVVDDYFPYNAEKESWAFARPSKG